MKLKQLEYFIAVCETLNFTRAAERLFVSQTAVSQQIKLLEEELGVALLYRSNHRVELTPAGRIFQEDALAIQKRLRDASQRVQASTISITGVLKLGFVKGYEKRIAGLLNEYHTRYPNIALDLFRENTAELCDHVLRGDLDLAFNHIYPSDGLSELNIWEIEKCALLAIMTKSHPLAARSRISASELKGFPLVDFQKDTQYGQSEVISNFFAAAGFVPEVRFISDDIETSVLAVASGIGYALLPSYFLDYLNSWEQIIAVPILDCEEKIEIAAIWSKKRRCAVRDLLIEGFLHGCQEASLQP